MDFQLPPPAVTAWPRQAVELGSTASLEQSTAAGKKRQPVVMCATLVDKVRIRRTRYST